MTIALGFVHRDGVLLAADTQHESLTMKSHATKLRQLNYWDGHIAFAYAGNSAFALSAIEKCTKRIRASHKGEDPAALAEMVLDQEYRRVVHRHPDRLIDPYIPYQLLIAIQRRTKKRTELYATYDVSLSQVNSYESVGIGKPLADYLVLPIFTAGEPEHDVICLAAHVVSIAKRHVPACGGMSLLLSLRNDGTISELYGNPMVEHLEAEAAAYFAKAQQLLFRHVDSQMSETDFEGTLQLFKEYVQQMRQRWNQTWERVKPRPIL